MLIKNRSILVVGEFRYDFYEMDFCERLIENGHNVDYIKMPVDMISIIYRVELHYNISLFNTFISNISLLNQVIRNKYDIVLFWRTPIVGSVIVRLIKVFSNAKILSYNNDNPFPRIHKENVKYQNRLWKKFINTIKLHDINLVYRESNIEDYCKYGSNCTRVLLPYYIKKYIPDRIEKRVKERILFIGHYEKYRYECIEHLIKSGIKVDVYGTLGWEDHEETLGENLFKRKLSQVEYYRTISNYKIALTFLSKLNKDVYTRRNFEIPSVKTLNISEYSDELNQIFKENDEIVFFRDKNELLQKAIFYLSNEVELERISINAQKKVTENFELENFVFKIIEV